MGLAHAFEAPSHTPTTRIGVRLSALSQNLEGTLNALYATTSQALDVIVLADLAPEEATALGQRLGPLTLPRTLVDAPGGGAACFNRLVAEQADLYVLLEAGTQPGPDWLGLLQAALSAGGAHGLAGPSMTWSWNEQGVGLQGLPTAAGIAAKASALKAEYGSAWRSMSPLWSLSDVCLAVRRAVIDAVGAADESYGRGPCWEMDYAARAARAGFDSVWAKSAFVHRPSLSQAQRAEEGALLEANKHRYQRRFCGRRHREGEGAAFHEHCRGDACANFAPPATTEIRLSFPPASCGPVPAPRRTPVISCVMPTRGRRRFVDQAVGYFRRQDYPNKELIIVHERDDDLPEGLEGPDVRCVRVAGGLSIGAKRQAGAEAAKGEILAHWDDDDWYAPTRLSRQVAPILAGVADITGLNDVSFLNIAERRCWQVTPELFARMFLENVVGGTLTFPREVWRRSGPYPAISLREDCGFMAQAMRRGARLLSIPGRTLCVYVRHEMNTWKFAEGRFLSQSGWSMVSEPPWLGPDRDFYFSAASHRQAMRAAPRPGAADAPLVTCIMPTANRRPFIAAAVGHFLRQDYPRRELLVVDDGEAAVDDLIPSDPTIRYIRLDRRISLGAKRNLACELARGELIAHWDDDDWMARQWLSAQVKALQDGGADVCGLEKVLFYAPDTREAWRYVYDGGQPWLCGGTLCYTKAYWARAPFARIDIGEDNTFVWAAEPKRVAVNDREELYVATIHRGNTSPKITSGHRWRPMSAQFVEGLMAAH